MQAILSSKRDARIDVLRGLSLLMIFVDHIPGNKLGFATLHVFGFADAAEVFVLFAGFASMLAYGKGFLREGALSGTRRVALRCLRIYATQVLLLMATLVIVRVWTKYFHQAPGAVAPLLDSPGSGVLHGLALHALPGYLDILPLYIVLLAVFPLLFVAMRWNVWAALAASGALWGLVHLHHEINLPNWLDANGWYFDPFSWQFLFAIGAALAVFMAGCGGAVPRRPWLTALCWVYLAGAFLETFPFDAYGLPSWRPFAMYTIDKTHLSFWRILDILAWGADYLQCRADPRLGRVALGAAAGGVRAPFAGHLRAGMSAGAHGAAAVPHLRPGLADAGRGQCPGPGGDVRRRTLAR